MGTDCDERTLATSTFSLQLVVHAPCETPDFSVDNINNQINNSICQHTDEA